MIRAINIRLVKLLFFVKPFFVKLFFLATLLCPVLATHAEELSLPEKSPELGVSAESKLGTRENGIGLAPGSKVKTFEINDHSGKPASFDMLKSRAPLLVIFYRGGWCPYCNVQIRQLAKAWPEFQKRGVTPVLISVDKPDAAALAQRQYEIPFPVLSDPELKAHERFGVTMEVEDSLIPKYKSYGIDIEKWSGKTHHKIAVSSAFVVNNDGIVLWSHSASDYKTRPSVEQFLTVLDGLKTQF
jgi:peroxiredoxin